MTITKKQTKKKKDYTLHRETGSPSDTTRLLTGKTGGLLFIALPTLRLKNPAEFTQGYMEATICVPTTTKNYLNHVGISGKSKIKEK